MQHEICIQTNAEQEIIDITAQIEKMINIKQGICTVYVPHATAAIMINESADPNIMEDILTALDKIIPAGKWKHDAIDNNGAAHIKAGLIGPSEQIPILNGKLGLGTWQGIMLCDFDGPRKRKIIVMVQ
ncbi:YjbQ family protein [Candidatus Woesearchaeota archaeon]|nr:YjbQ family protein [Candidatus Woesearchaeota archaeon]